MPVRLRRVVEPVVLALCPADRDAVAGGRRRLADDLKARRARLMERLGPDAVFAVGYGAFYCSTSTEYRRTQLCI
jgi:hypothetical protein